MEWARSVWSTHNSVGLYDVFLDFCYPWSLLRYGRGKSRGRARR